jgi:hypothetical protein
VGTGIVAHASNIFFFSGFFFFNIQDFAILMYLDNVLLY